MTSLFTAASLAAAYPVTSSILEFMLPKDTLPAWSLRYNWLLALACVLEVTK